MFIKQGLYQTPAFLPTGFYSCSSSNITTKMDKERIYRILFSGVYPLYIQKAEKKGCTKEEADTIICWLTGYNKEGLQQQLDQKTDFTTFLHKHRS